MTIFRSKVSWSVRDADIAVESVNAMDKNFETVSTTTRFGHGPDEEDITIDYFDEKRFEVHGKNIAGPMIVALDGSLAPEVPKGARLLVNERHTEVNERGIYVFRNNVCKGFDIAIIEPLEDGAFRYVYDNANPQIHSDLSGMELVGRVWEIQMLTEIDEYQTAANGSVRFNKAERKKIKLWFPIWTDDLHQKA